jgi:hypothetical protein
MNNYLFFNYIIAAYNARQNRISRIGMAHGVITGCGIQSLMGPGDVVEGSLPHTQDLADEVV